jgi:long-chain acyl-CoA synthetase
MRAGALDRPRRELADRLVLSKVRGVFGDDLRLALSGAAPIGREILEFFDACGVLVLEGYGLTETCAASTLNTRRAHRFGTVGQPLPGTDVRIAADGEVLLRGPHVFAGYHRNGQATTETLADGWLYTGDLGSVDEDGFVRITGRKKELIITSSGKNISPTNIEELLLRPAGSRRRSCRRQALLPCGAAHARSRRGRQAGRACRHRARSQRSVLPPGGRAAVRGRLGQRALARIEQIKRFAVLDHDLSRAAGELTPTLKIKRGVVAEHYGDRVEELYA